MIKESLIFAHPDGKYEALKEKEIRIHEYINICPICGKTFISKRNDAIYCKDGDCRRKVYIKKHYGIGEIDIPHFSFDINNNNIIGFNKAWFYLKYPKFTYDIYNEIAWIRKSLEILNEDNRICKDCWGLALEVHHLKNFYKYPEIALLRDNLISLCKKHHEIRHKNNKNYLTNY